MTILETFSLAANIVFVTWGIVDHFARKREKEETSNYFNAGYEMARRLADSTKAVRVKGQVEDIASFLMSATMNSMNQFRNEIDDSSSAKTDSKT